jgi:hypothetical protein
VRVGGAAEGRADQRQAMLLTDRQPAVAYCGGDVLTGRGACLRTGCVEHQELQTRVPTKGRSSPMRDFAIIHPDKLKSVQETEQSS